MQKFQFSPLMSEYSTNYCLAILEASSSKYAHRSIFSSMEVSNAVFSFVNSFSFTKSWEFLTISSSIASMRSYIAAMSSSMVSYSFCSLYVNFSFFSCVHVALASVLVSRPEDSFSFDVFSSVFISLPSESALL